MSALLLSLVGNVLPGLLDRIIPDPQKAAEAKLEMLKMAQAGEFKEVDAQVQMALGQMEINKAEAQTDNFRGGWRPAVGWVCVFGLFYQFLLQPIVPWAVTAFGGHVSPLPAIDNNTLMVLLTGMLGLGGLRSLDKIKGVS